MVLSGTSNTACVCGADPWDYPSSNAPVKHHFNGKVAQGDLCVCDPPITLATCQAIFPGLPVAPAAGVACDCRCTNNCVNAGRDTTTGNWFTVAPDSWWDPHHGCNCSCWNVFPGANWVQAPNRTYVPGVGCPCNNTCAAGKQPDPDSLDCSCVCVPQDCGPNALQNSDSCACQCRFGGTWPGGCNSAPSGG